MSEITYCGYNCPNRDCERHSSHSRYTYDSFAWFDSCPNRPRGEYWIDLTDYCPSDYGVGDEPVEEPLWNWECPNCGEHIFEVENPPSKCPNCGSELKPERRG